MYNDSIRIVRGSQRYVGSLDRDESIPMPLEASRLNMIEGDRNATVNLPNQYYLEREFSSTYRLYGGIMPITSNPLTGCTSDPTFVGYELYYVPDPVTGLMPTSADTEACGYPSFQFFDFIPQGVIQPWFGLTTEHLWNEFSAKTDTWALYESYVYRHDSEQPMRYLTDYTTQTGVEFEAQSGIPFYTQNVEIQGKAALQFVCPVKHGLSAEDHVIFDQGIGNGGTSNAINGSTLLTDINGEVFDKVFSLGSVDYNTEEYVFNIILREPSASNLPPDGQVGNFRKITNIQNSAETLCDYYVHIHKLLTNPEDYFMGTTGFQKGIFTKREKYFLDKDSPVSKICHPVWRNEYKGYEWNFNNDLDVGVLSDNLNRPITDLYLTIFATNMSSIWKPNAADGINHLPDGPQNTQSSLGYGWDWNFIPVGVEDDFPSFNPTNIISTGVGIQFPVSGDTFRGAFVEYNKFELEERVISEISHKLKFNPGTFSTPTGGEIPGGYTYQSHHRIPIRKYSVAIETEPNYKYVPQYAYYSQNEQLWRWRSILDIGFFDSPTNGVGYPYTNDAHYPFKMVPFYIKPVFVDEDKNFVTEGIILPPDIDDCQ